MLLFKDYMKKLLLTLILGASVAFSAMPVKANPETIKLAKALIMAGVALPLAFEIGRLAYKGGYFESVKDFCKERPWWAAGGALITLACGLLCKDAAINALSPLFGSSKVLEQR